MNDRFAGAKDGIDTFAAVPLGDDGGTRYMLGHLEDDDMLVRARDVKITGLKQQNCLLVPELEPHGPEFDYDLQVKSEARATTAKLVRFVETVADEAVGLVKNYAPHDEPVDAAKAQKVLKFKKVLNEKSYEVELLGTEARVVFAGAAVNGEGMPTGPGQFKVLTDWRRRDIMPVVSSIKAEREKKAKKMAERDMARMNGEDVEEDEDEEEENKDELLNEDALELNETDADNLSEEYLNEFVPFDQMPVVPIKWLKRVVSVKGVGDDDGMLQGHVTLTYGDGSTTEALVRDGAFHGMVRNLAPPLKRGRRKRYVKRQVENAVIATGMYGKDDPVREVTFAGVYRNGYLDGPGWQFLVGGSFLFGKFDGEMAFTTKEGAYLNQDLETGYVGEFKDGKMAAGRVARVVGVAEEAGVKMPVFSEPAADAEVYRFVEAEKGEVRDPTVTDLTEDNWVYVAESATAGEGLFAKRDVPENTVVAYFGGMRFSFAEWNETKPLDPNYWITADDGTVLHLPEELGADTAKYRATLGHKINHSFDKWNCMFHSLDHPRFGLIPAARTTEKVDKDRELLCLYEIKYHEGAPWFQELWRRQLDLDFVYGPFGHRGARRNASEAIAPMLTDAKLYGEFERHAAEVLGLEPVT